MKAGEVQKNLYFIQKALLEITLKTKKVKLKYSISDLNQWLLQDMHPIIMKII